MNPEKIYFSWTTEEFIKYQKTPLWFVVAGLIGLVVLTIAIFMKSYLFAILILIFSFLVYIEALRKPRKINFKISNFGIYFLNNFLPFEDLKSFWVFEKPEFPILSLEYKRPLKPKLSIPLGNLEINEVKKVLSEFIEEKEQKESLMDIMAEKLRF